MSLKNKYYCNSCGGPIRTSYTHCKYCGTPVIIERQLFDEDRKRMVIFGLMMDHTFYRITTKDKHKTNQLFVVPNIILLLGLSVLIYLTTYSLMLLGILLLLLALYIVKSYYQDYLFVAMNIAKERVYKKIIEPAINQFLSSFNYPGCEWKSIIHELNAKGKLFWLHYYFGDAEDIHHEEQKMNAVLRFLNTSLSRHINLKRRQRRTLFYLTTGYAMVLTLPLSALFLPYAWIPLVWIIPGLIFLYLEMVNKTFVLITLPIFNPLRNRYEPSLMHNEIVPVLTEYCIATHNEIGKMTVRARELDLFYLSYNLEKMEAVSNVPKDQENYSE